MQPETSVCHQIVAGFRQRGWIVCKLIRQLSSGIGSERPAFSLRTSDAFLALERWVTLPSRNSRMSNEIGGTEIVIHLRKS